MRAVCRAVPVHDPQVLRAIAHPVRNRILGELDAQGSLRAADIARDLGIPANQASFHLRQLAKYGLVEADAGAARDKRDRVWRLAARAATSPSTSRTSRRPRRRGGGSRVPEQRAGLGPVRAGAAYGDERARAGAPLPHQQLAAADERRRRGR